MATIGIRNYRYRYRYSQVEPYELSVFADSWKSLSCPTLLVMLYKIHHQTVACPLIRSKLLAAPKRQRRGHDQQFQLATPRIKYRRGSFVPHTIREWNELPSGTVKSETLGTFVSRLVHKQRNCFGLLGHRTNNVLGLWFLANNSALEQRIQIHLGSNKAIIIVQTILGNYYKKKKK